MDKEIIYRLNESELDKFVTYLHKQGFDTYDHNKRIWILKKQEEGPTYSSDGAYINLSHEKSEVHVPSGSMIEEICEEFYQSWLKEIRAS